MLTRIIRSIMPREERFVELFSAHSLRLVEAAAALTAMMKAEGQPERGARIEEVGIIETKADLVAKDTMVALHKAFITPFDRSDIHALITAMDDAVDLIEEVSQHTQIYRVEEFGPLMLDLAGLIERAAALLAEVIPLLSDVNRNIGLITGLCQQVGAIEGEADRILRQAVSDLVASNPPPITFLGMKEMYELLETVTDRCDDVADLIEGIVLDHV